MGRDLLLVTIESEATLSDDAHGILLLWRRDRVRRVAEVEAATRALLLLATEGDTKVGAGQSQERGLSRQTENDHHTVTPPFGNISPDWPASHFVFIRGDAARTMGSQDKVEGTSMPIYDERFPYTSELEMPVIGLEAEFKVFIDDVE